MKMFSPALTRRKEPPSSMATVLLVSGKTAMVSFRGRTLTAAVLDQDENHPVLAGETLRLLEHPRGVFHVKRTGISWYANPLENWIKKGFKANATLEYFMRKCRKWSPLITGANGELVILPLDQWDDDRFDGLDKDGDGRISEDEWKDGGGDEDTFRKIDKNGDGFIDRDEFNAWTIGGGLMKSGSESGGGTEPETPAVWITVTPKAMLSAGDVVVEWGSTSESSVTVKAGTVTLSTATSGSMTVSITKTMVFTIAGGSGTFDSDCCFVGLASVPQWWIFLANTSFIDMPLVIADGYRNIDTTGYDPAIMAVSTIGDIDYLPYRNFLPKTQDLGGVLYYGSGLLQRVGFNGVPYFGACFGSECASVAEASADVRDVWMAIPKIMTYRSAPDAEVVTIIPAPSIVVLGGEGNYTVFANFAIVDV